MAKKSEKIEEKTSIWRRLFPGRNKDDTGQTQALDIPSPGIMGDYIGDPFDPRYADSTAVQSEDEQGGYELPRDRVGKYGVFRLMASDPSIDAAIKSHVSHALSAKPDTGEIVSIESTSDKDDPITLDLRDTFKEIIQQNCHGWAYNAAINGVCYSRVYGAPRVGVKLVRTDYYTHPAFIKEYARAGSLAGYTAAYQSAVQERHLVLLEPWKFVAFKIPCWEIPMDIEPIRYDTSEFNIGADDFEREGLVETSDYGKSLVETAYGPWMDLLESILSLNLSRKNAARLERLIGVNTGKLSPQRAADYLGLVAKQLKKIGKENARKSLARGFVQTVINHMIPILGDAKGRLDVSTVEGSPNIDGIEDVNFHVKRLGAALGIDPSLIGFGEMMSGGLGDGGFFRLSILAGIKANMLRHAIQTGIERLFDIHVAYKFGKVFPPGHKPWRVMFNSTSSALEREEMEAREARVNFATSLAALVQLVDPEYKTLNPTKFNNFIWTDLLKVDEQKFIEIFTPDAKPKGDSAEGGESENGEVFESAGSVRQLVFDTMTKFYQGGEA